MPKFPSAADYDEEHEFLSDYEDAVELYEEWGDILADRMREE